ncbi:trypsin-like serine protease [uncultured Jannaschia sp.]|uniref:trypsin-like serine peptidase n=1 Tax=uncultured Jannaschia sp. TaxID=293347 RepID=UPI0034333A07
MQPFSAVCHIGRDFGAGGLSGCTAFLIGPRLMLTAGHCLYSLKRGRGPGRILVTPARNGTERPFGSQWARSWYVPPAFMRRPVPSSDWGVLHLSRPFAGIAPFTPLALSNATLAQIRSNQLLSISGYPSDKPRGEMWTHQERLDRFGTHLLSYSVDTCPGQSGAPIWVSRADGSPGVIGVHTRGPTVSAQGPWGCRPGAPFAPPSHFNAGVRLTPGLIAAAHAAKQGRGPLRRPRRE